MDPDVIRDVVSRIAPPTLATFSLAPLFGDPPEVDTVDTVILTVHWAELHKGAYIRLEGRLLDDVGMDLEFPHFQAPINIEIDGVEEVVRTSTISAKKYNDAGDAIRRPLGSVGGIESWESASREEVFEE